MRYEPFTLKYRPRTFSDLVGQGAVGDTLARAVASDRVANAYLFCGSRGVGKTSMARILAKALNCPESRDGTPCNECEVCTAIGAGDDIDVIEIDGASNRGIDDVRAIRDNAGFVPSRSPYKIYIIDEVHMLTIQAFNALLKVLEEPPPHVRFIFATTDPNNLPDTILSRCQRHEFRRIGVDDIVDRLRAIADAEGLEVEEPALRAMASRSQGGLRDSVSALDQVVSYAGKKVTLGDLERAIGILPREHLERLFRAIAEGQSDEVLRTLQAAFQGGFDPREILNETTSLLREMMIYSADSESYRDRENRSLFDPLAVSLGFDRVMYLLRLFLNAAGEIKKSGHERTQVELTCLKAARSTELLPVAEIMERLKGKVPAPAPALGTERRPADLGAAASRTPIASSAPAEGPERAASSARQPSPSRSDAPDAPPSEGGPSTESPRKAAAPRKAPTAPAERAEARPGASAGDGEPRAASPETVRLDDARLAAAWPEIVASIKKVSAPLAVALGQARPERVEGRRAILSVPGNKNFVYEQLTSPETQRRLNEALASHFGAGATVAIIKSESAAAASSGSDGESRRTVYEDPAVQKFIQHFDGGISNVEKKDG